MQAPKNTRLLCVYGGGTRILKDNPIQCFAKFSQKYVTF